jgi:NitT/TauT family transport system substrate-binding protein
MSRLRFRLALPTGIVLIASLAAACGGSESSASNGLEKKTVTVAALPVVDTAGLHVAVQQKFFDAEGLRVQIKPVAQSIQALPALKTGQVDVIAGGNYVTFLQAQAQRALDLCILAAGAAVAPRFMAVRTMPGSSIRQPRDLQGRTVAVNILNNIQSLTLNEILKANNIDPATVKYRAIPFPQMGAALQKGQVDAVHTAEPFGTDIQRKLDARLVLDGGTGPVAGLPVSGYLTTQRFVSRYPKTAAAFQRAIGKAQQLASSDRTKVDQVLPSYAHIDAKTASALSLPALPASTDPVSMQRLADLMLRNGLLKTAIDAKSLIFVPGAK